MSDGAKIGTMTPAAALDLGFLDARHKLIEIAAFLDRIERAGDQHGDAKDYRLAAFKQALNLAADGEGDKARRVQMVFSDPTAEPLASAAGMKGATGAWPGGDAR